MKMQLYMLPVLSCLLAYISCAKVDLPIHSFTTGGAPVYHVQPATVEAGGERVVISAAYDGTVQCHRPDGALLWKSATGGFFPNDLAVEDLNNDGLDESLIASSDGSLYAFNPKGDLLWKYPGTAPLLTVSVAQTGNSKIILAGGIERIIYALSADGKVLHTYTAPYIIRFIRKGNILGNGQDQAAVVLAKQVRGKDQWYLQLFNLDDLTPVWPENVNIATENLTECYFDLLTADIDKNGADDIILSHGWRDLGKLSAYNAAGEQIALPAYQPQGITRATYRMNRITHVKSSSLNDEYLLGLFGTQIITYNLDLTMRAVYNTAYSYANGAFDPVTNIYYMGSSISGGDCIHAVNLADARWGQAYENLKAEGNLARILDNVDALNRNIEKFVRPAYQPVPAPVQVIGSQPEESVSASLPNTSFITYTSFHEAYDRSSLPGIWKTKKETRFQYDDTQEEIWQYAKTMEEKGEKFAVWAGHGNDPYYMQFETLEGIVRLAPNAFQAFVFPEMERTDENMVAAVNERIIPLADLCQRHGKKIILRSKMVYWYGSCYLNLWKSTLLSGKYRDVFVPSMEETNDRCQDLSLSGRLGLWLTGYFDQYSARAVTDGACYHRLWEFCSQQVLTHFTRPMVLGAALGADMLLINIYQGAPEQLNPLYAMLDKGVIHIPQRDDILSISDVCLGIRKPSMDFIEHGNNGWKISGYEPEERSFVFDRMDCYWGGAPILPHDFSYYGTGSRSRLLNFLPKNPHGLVAFVPDDIDLSQHPRFTRKISTDGECFYDEQGVRRTAEEYAPVVEQYLKDAAQRLPVRVEGDISWTTTRIDPHHIRLVLIDGGYIDPADRSAVVYFQNLQVTECRDILTGEQLSVAKDTMSLTVPAGIFRVVDITHD